MEPSTLKIASWNCAGAFREKVQRALALDADVYVIQEAEPLDRYAALLPAGSATHYVVRPGDAKGVLVFTRPGHALTVPTSAGPQTYSHIVPLTVTAPAAAPVTLWAVWTLDASPREAAYVGQAHLALDDLADELGPRTVMIGDYNSNAIWDHAVVTTPPSSTDWPRTVSAPLITTGPETPKAKRRGRPSSCSATNRSRTTSITASPTCRSSTYRSERSRSGRG